MSTPVQKLFDLSGKSALVTGGSRGLGLQIAEALGQAGAKILLTSRKAPDLEEAAADLRTAFAGKRLDAATGRRYRNTVLANGGQVAPDDLLKEFLGRPSDSRAFFNALNKQ